jgi:hypothetical protein
MAKQSEASIKREIEAEELGLIRRDLIEHINALAADRTKTFIEMQDAVYDWELQDMGDYVRLRDVLTQSTIGAVDPAQLNLIYDRVKAGKDLVDVVAELEKK